MPLRIYNTLTGKKEDFVPLRSNHVGLYVCGVTVYDLSHIGHARSTVVFDTIFRYLRYRGYDVTYVRNFTDIDDKIINRANEEGVDCREIAERYIEEFNKDMASLGVEKPTYEPKATDHIPEMIGLISRLMEKGYAYRTDGDVYFSVERFREYGKLSKRNPEEMLAGARVEVDEKKKNPLDFALWKSSKPGEPCWESPWGMGRPGWHIECSVMSQKYLGETFDIHGGGKDLIFPHHENEIAQSEAANGKTFVRYWIHNGFVNINREKMSKSLGNILSIREALRKWHREAIRLFLLSHHYRSPVDFSEDAVAEAQSGLDRFYLTIRSIKEEMLKSPSSRTETETSTIAGIRDTIGAFRTKVEEAMDDDFNTALALSHFYELQTSLNRLLALSKKHLTEETLSLFKQGHDLFLELGWIFGIFQEDPDRYLEGRKAEGLKKLGLTEDEILLKIEERQEARKLKDWTRADEIRNYLLSRGIVLEDTPAGTKWRIKD